MQAYFTLGYLKIGTLSQKSERIVFKAHGKSWIMLIIIEQNYQNELMQKHTSNELVVRKLV